MEAGVVGGSALSLPSTGTVYLESWLEMALRWPLGYTVPVYGSDSGLGGLCLYAVWPGRDGE